MQNTPDCPADVKELLNTYDWYMLPVLNPDGYTYTRGGVSIYILLCNMGKIFKYSLLSIFRTECGVRRDRVEVAVALESIRIEIMTSPSVVRIFIIFYRFAKIFMNFNKFITGAATTNNPCSDQYHGGTAFSEPETRNEANFLMSQRSRIKFFLSIHTYSQMMFMPWSYTSQRPPEYSELVRII